MNSNNNISNITKQLSKRKTHIDIGISSNINNLTYRHIYLTKISLKIDMQYNIFNDNNCGNVYINVVSSQQNHLK